MAINNPTQDSFNPPSNMSQDFEEYYFEDLELNELNRLKVNIDEFLVKHYQIDDVAEEKPEKQLLQEDK